MQRTLILDRKIIFVALASALVISLIYGFPHFLIKNQITLRGEIYSPITIFSDGDEAQIYAPQIGEAAKGRIALSDPALKEHENDFSLLTPLGPFVLGAFARVIGIEKVWVLADFFLPPLIFLIFFALIFEITGSAYFSLVSGGIFIFTREIASLIPFSTFGQFKQFAVYFKPFITSAVENRLPFDRLLSPEWTFLPLGIFFLLWIISFKRAGMAPIIACGGFFGLLFYSYPFDWLSVSVILGTYFLLSLAAKDYGSAKKTCLVFVIGLITSLPYWFSFLGIRQYPQYDDLVVRTGLEVGRVFRIFLLPHYILWLAAAAWLYLRRKEDKLALPAVAIFISAFFIMNLQLVTGYVPQPDHFLRYPLALALSVAFVICGFLFWSRFYSRLEIYRRFLWVAALAALLLVSVRAVELQLAYAKENSWRYKLDSAADESFAWMRKNVARDSVILSPSVITNANILLFTQAKVFVPSTGVITSASNKELVERFIIAAKIFGASDERIKTVFSKSFLERKIAGAEDQEDRVAAHLYHYGLHSQEPDAAFKEKGLRSFEDVDAAVFEALAGWNKNREIMLKKYKLEYLYSGPNEKNKFNFSENRFGRCLTEVYGNKDIEIYRIEACFYNL